MFKTKRLTLRGYRSSDEGFFLDLFDNYNVIANLADDYAAPNLGGHRDMLEKMTKCALFVVVQDSDTCEAMGFTLLSISTSRNLDGDLGMALAEKHWGKVYATEILEWLKDYCSKVLGLRRLSLFVFSSNKRAKNLYERRCVCLHTQIIFILLTLPILDNHSGFLVEGRI